MKPEKRETEPELRPDGWDRFEKAVDEAMKASPKRHVESGVKSEKAEPPAHDRSKNYD